MKNLSKLALLLLMMLLLAACGSSAKSKTAEVEKDCIAGESFTGKKTACVDFDDEDSDQEQVLDKFLVDNNFSGVARIVINDRVDSLKDDSIALNNEINLSKTYGFADKQAQTKVTPNNTFKVGSISKVFTATIIFQLIEENKLTLEDNLSRWYDTKDFDKNASHIKIKHLLRHSSGIWDFISIREPNLFLELVKVYAFDYSKTADELIKKVIVKKELSFEPGTKFKYSNSNYLILGDIIAKITKSTYKSQLKTRIIDKLDLKNTFYEDNNWNRPGRALGYITYGLFKTASELIAGTYGPRALVDRLNYNIISSAGAVVSNSNDLMKFLKVLLLNKDEGGLLSTQSMLAMKSIDSKVSKTFGLGIQKYFSVTKGNFYGHGGLIFGYSALAAYNPKSESYIILLANEDGLKDTALAGLMSKILQEK